MTDTKTDKPDTYVATGEIKFGIHAGYQPGDPVSAQVVKDHDLVNKGLVKKA